METREMLCESFLSACHLKMDPVSRQSALRKAMEMTPHGSCSNTFEHGEDAFAMYKSMLESIAGKTPHT